MKNSLFFLLAFFSLFAAAESTVYLDELDLTLAFQTWKRPLSKKSVEGNPLNVGGKLFERGVGAHAPFIYGLKLEGPVKTFEGFVGIDSEQGNKGKAAFKIYADDKLVFESQSLGEGAETFGPIPVKIELSGVKLLELVIDPLEDEENAHADWLDAKFSVEDGAVITPVSTAGEQWGILTPQPLPIPRINGPAVLGVRPGSPVIWRLPVSGERPLQLTVEKLPIGLAFDAEQGILTGSIKERGDYPLTFTAKNSKGVSTKTVTLKVGDKIAPTPPMGWNSWNCFAHTVRAEDIRAAADIFISSGLADHGWLYINIDDFWQNRPDEKSDETLMGPERQPDGTIQPNKRFPDMKALADYVHAKGLRIGLYSSPGPLTCGRCTGSWGHEWQDAKTYASWGYDYLKYDWCSYSRVDDTSYPDHYLLPYALMGEALRAQNRDILFSLCQYGWWNVSTWGSIVKGSCWRTTGDINPTFSSMAKIIKQQEPLWLFAGPDAWNDPDMLIVGVVGFGNPQPTSLTPNEQYTHLSLWAMLCSPLLIGCDLTKLDDFTLSLLTNDEVIEINQDELGAQAAKVVEGEGYEVWAKPMSDGSIALAVFNNALRQKVAKITVDLEELGLDGSWLIRDLWRQKDLGIYSATFTCEVPSHATQLVRLFPQSGAKLRDGLNDIRDNAIYRKFLDKRPIDKPGYKKAASNPCPRCRE